MAKVNKDFNKLTFQLAELSGQGHVVVVCGPVDEQVVPGTVIAHQQEDALLLLTIQLRPENWNKKAQNIQVVSIRWENILYIIS